MLFLKIIRKIPESAVTIFYGLTGREHASFIDSTM